MKQLCRLPGSDGGRYREDAPDSGMTQSVGEHQEVPKGNAVVKPVKWRKKQHRGRKLAAGQRGEPKELTRGIYRSRKKLATACRKVSRRATAAWRKRNVFRKYRTQGNCDPRQELAAGRKSLAVQEWHDARETSSGNIRPGAMLSKNSGKDERRKTDVGKARDAKRE
jgi:hypothetical protein